MTRRLLAAPFAVLLLAFALASGARAQSPYAKPGEPLDYGLLGHKLVVELLRAGTHDPEGKNEYHFRAVMYGLVSTPEERNLPFEKRKKVPVELGTFGDTTLLSLSIWRPDEKAGDVKVLEVDGNLVRELVARSMTELGVGEPLISVRIDVTLVLKQRKYYFFGEEKDVATVSYHPIPPNAFEGRFRTNATLPMTDDKGLEVRLGVRYDKPLETRGATSAQAPAPAKP